MKCDFCGSDFSGVTEGRFDGGYAGCYDCIDSMMENEAERRGVRQAEQDFASYHGGTAAYPFTDAERQEEQARIQREYKQ